MTETKVHIPEDLLAFKQVLLDDLIRILEQRQPVTLRRWLKRHEVLHVLGISRHKLEVLREQGALVFKEVAGSYFYDYESVMKFNAEPGPERGVKSSPRSTVHGPQLNAAVGHAPQLYAGQENEAEGQMQG